MMNLVTLEVITATINYILGTSEEPLLQFLAITWVTSLSLDSTVAHILHGWKAHQITTRTKSRAEQVRIELLLLEHFIARWRHEYLTSLREFHFLLEEEASQ